MTNEPMTQKKRGPWIWIALGCIGLLAIVFVVGFILTRNFLSSDDGKSLMAGIKRTESMSASLPVAADGFEKYVSEKGDFPPTLDDLKGYIDATTLEKIKTEMTYIKPAKDAPPDTVILTTGTDPFMQGSFMEIRLEKDFKPYQITKQPLDER